LVKIWQEKFWIGCTDLVNAPEDGIFGITPELKLIDLYSRC
jgi:hypothetical protein